MDIYELSVDSSDASELLFPIPEQKERFLLLIDEKISNGLSVKGEWEEFLVSAYSGSASFFSSLLGMLLAIVFWLLLFAPSSG